MKRYLGTKGDLATSIIAVFYSFGSVAFSVYILINYSNLIAIVFAVFILSMTVFSASVLYRSWELLFPYGIFDHDHVTVRNILGGRIVLRYDQCVDCGIAYYTHTVVRSDHRIKKTYIYLSVNYLSEQEKQSINSVHYSASFVKIGYDYKTYLFLKKNLPVKQALMLEENFKINQV
ncbi:MAG: hypothetical protein IJS22_05795 [Lachnospiraceae bacterium]|nr:hypothetical protein [Lachnospiraceae bacterium]